MEKREIELVLFDLDGTLLTLNFDSEGSRAELHDFFHKQFGLDLYFKPVLQKLAECEKTIEQMQGGDAAKAAKEKGLSILVKKEREALEGSKILPHAQECIEAFKKRGIKVGVFSRTTKEVVLEGIKRHGLGGFDLIVGREDTKESKPSPESVIFSLNELDVKPENCLVVGDHPYDIISGNEAGTMTAAVLTGIGRGKDLKEAGADYVFKDLRELLDGLVEERLL